MYGSATLAMVWSSACISVATMVQSVMISAMRNLICGAGGAMWRHRA